MKWCNLFTYNAETGELTNRFNINGRALKDDLSGYVNDSGYRVVRVKGKTYRCHRIVWEMHNGPISKDLEIDHINRIRNDNRIENLRLATRHEQNLNLSQRVSKTGVTGVVYRKKNSKWQAQIGFKGRHIYLGIFNDFFEACCVRKSAEINYGFKVEL